MLAVEGGYVDWRGAESDLGDDALGYIPGLFQVALPVGGQPLS